MHQKIAEGMKGRIHKELEKRAGQAQDKENPDYGKDELLGRKDSNLGETEDVDGK